MLYCIKDIDVGLAAASNDNAARRPWSFRSEGEWKWSESRDVLDELVL